MWTFFVFQKTEANSVNKRDPWKSPKSIRRMSCHMMAYEYDFAMAQNLNNSDFGSKYQSRVKSPRWPTIQSPKILRWPEIRRENVFEAKMLIFGIQNFWFISLGIRFWDLNLKLNFRGYDYVGSLWFAYDYVGSNHMRGCFIMRPPYLIYYMASVIT